MSYFQIGIQPDGSLRRAGEVGLMGPGKTAVSSVHGLSKVEEVKSTRSSGRSSGGHRVTASDFNTSRFSAPNEKLTRDTILDDITPKDDANEIKLFNRMYREDAVAGSATDLLATLPWSGWTLSGISDPAIMRIYEEATEKFDPEVTMPDISRDYLKLGRVIMSLVFDDEQQTWVNWIPLDPMYCELTPIPLNGFDPMIDYKPDPVMQKFLESKDPRARFAQSRLPTKMRKKFAQAGSSIPLDVATTMFLARRVSLNDWKGTSLYHRILPYYALERELMSSTIAASRRRVRSILHLTIGTESWEPDQDQLDQTVEAFQTTEEDPVGAIIATRSGVEASEIRSGGDFWKISEEADFLKSGKLAALGLSESFLTGEASYQTVDAAMSVLIENLKVFRSSLTQKVFTNKYFENLARAHNFVKRSQADLAHGTRTSIKANPSTEEAMSIPKRDLLIPTLNWTKNLSPESDANYMDILEKIQGQGVPVTLKQWASAAGIDITNLEQMLPEDAELRKRIKKFLPKPPADGEGGGGGGDFGAFGSTKHVDITGSLALGSALNKDANKKSVLGVRHKDYAEVVATLTKDNRTQRILRDDTALSRWLYERYEGDVKKVDGMRYLLTRSGFADCRISTAYINDLAERLYARAKDFMDDKAMMKKIKREITILAAIYNYKSDKDSLQNSERSRATNKAIETFARKQLAKSGKARNLGSGNLYAGV